LANSDDFDFIGESENISSDDKSKKEEDFLISQENRRNEGVKNVAHWIFIWILRIGFVLICLVLITRVIHLVVPYNLRWLCPSDIAQMDKFLFSSSLGGLIGKYFSNVFGNSKA